MKVPGDGSKIIEMTDWINNTHIGDCRHLLPAMADDGVRVQTCVTSPPYFGLRDYGSATQIGQEPSVIAYVESLVGVFRLVRDLLADNGTLWLNLGDSYAGKELLGIPWKVAFSLQADGWRLRSDIIWHKPNPMPESVTDRPTKSHEYLFLLAKSERYYYDSQAIAEKSKYGGEQLGLVRGTKRRATAMGVIPSGNERPGADADISESRNRRSVWTVVTEPFSGAHFATFPRALITPCILAGSAAGEVVLDPFMGSGTTGQVATDLGRNYLGCELNPEYIKLHGDRRTTTGMAI